MLFGGGVMFGAVYYAGFNSIAFLGPYYLATVLFYVICFRVFESEYHVTTERIRVQGGGIFSKHANEITLARVEAIDFACKSAIVEIGDVCFRSGRNEVTFKDVRSPAALCELVRATQRARNTG
ncbi:MAG: hypothetical protein AAF585_07730 [Verrucomicrobiota bacterium]